MFGPHIEYLNDRRPYRNYAFESRKLTEDIIYSEYSKQRFLKSEKSVFLFNADDVSFTWSSASEFYKPCPISIFSIYAKFSEILDSSTFDLYDVTVKDDNTKVDRILVLRPITDETKVFLALGANYD